MKICPICQSTYDLSVDFCFKDGAPLDIKGDESGSMPSFDTLSGLTAGDLEPPDAISLSNIPAVSDDEYSRTDTLETSAVDLPEPTFTDLKPVGEDDETLDPFGGSDAAKFAARQAASEDAETQVMSTEDAASLPPDSGLPVVDEGLPPDPGALPEEEPTKEDKAPVDAAAKKTKKKSAGKKAAAGASGRARSKVTVDDRKSRPRKVKDTPVVSARLEKEPEPSSNKGLLIAMAVAALLLIGFIFTTLSGKNTTPEPPEPTPEVAEVETPEPTPEPTPEEVLGDDDSAGDDDDSSVGDGAGDGGDAVVDGAEAGDETPTEEPEPVEDPTAAEPTPEPRTPAPEPRTPAPEPTPAPGGAPELPIAVVADPTPAPEPATAAATDPGNPWNAPVEAATPAPVTDPSNPWGTAAVTSGTLVLSSQPSGASVSVNGSARGTTPLTLTLPFADYEVRVSKEEHASQTRVVKVIGAKPIAVDVVLESLAPPAAPAALQPVIIASNPGGAIVWVDGARQGATPLTVTIAHGSHTIKLQANGLPDCSKSLSVTAATRNAFYDLNNCN